MGTTSPTRVDDELFASAKLVGHVMSRSASQQITHWARVGRELEASNSVSQRNISAVLQDRLDYDELTQREQAVVRAEWAEQIIERREGLNLAEEFTRSGRSYVELNEKGNVVEHAATGAQSDDA